MEIKNTLLKSLDPYRNKIDQPPGDAPDRARSSVEQNSAPAQGDRVSLSPSALLHTIAHATASTAPTVRQEKVETIKRSLEEGTYVVDAKKVAQKLLESETLLAEAMPE